MTDAPAWSSVATKRTVPPRPRLVLLAPWACVCLIVLALVGRLNGTVWAESLALGYTLAIVYGLAVAGYAGAFLRSALWPAGLFGAWLVLFICSLTAVPVEPEPPISPPLPTLPARKVLHAYGPLSVVVGREWGRLVQPPPERRLLVVTDGVALTFSAEPFAHGDASEDLAAQADEMAEAICDDEGFRVSERWDGAVDGFATAERTLVKGERAAYCLLVITDRDGFRIVARGDSFDDFDDRDVVGEFRRIAASLRAVGADRDDPPAAFEPDEQEKPL